MQSFTTLFVDQSKGINLMNKQYSPIYSPVKLFILVSIALLGVLLFLTVRPSEGGYTATPTLHIFSADAAPEAGTVALYVQFGSRNQPEGSMLGSWTINQGERIDFQTQVRSRQRARLWFKPDNSLVWYLLPSQFWQIDGETGRGDGTCESEYGISADSDLPSYHTHFAKAIAQDDVPILRDSSKSTARCGLGSSLWREGPPPVATATIQATATPAPAATPCISLESDQFVRHCR